MLTGSQLLVKVVFAGPGTEGALHDPVTPALPSQAQEVPTQRWQILMFIRVGGISIK